MTPEWFTAWATAIGAVGTAGALIVAMLLLRAEQRARRAEEDREAIAVPSRVWVWWKGTLRLDPTEADRLKGAVPGFSIEAILKNGSDQPVYDVIVTMPTGPSSDLDPADLEILTPGQQCEVQMIHRRHPGGSSLDPIFGIPVVTFTDARGQRWRRDQHGLLHREPTLPTARWERLRESGRRQDQWFASWAENPFSRLRPPVDPSPERRTESVSD